LDDAIVSITEEFLGFPESVERNRVRWERPKIQSAVTHQLHELRHPFLSAWAKRSDDFVVVEARGKRFVQHGRLPLMPERAVQSQNGNAFVEFENADEGTRVFVPGEVEV
jgi:hypothetical protein